MLSLSLFDRCSKPFMVFVAFFWTQSTECMSLFNTTGPSTPQKFHQCEVGRNDPLALPAANAFPPAAQDGNISLFPEERVILTHLSVT